MTLVLYYHEGETATENLEVRYGRSRKNLGFFITNISLTLERMTTMSRKNKNKIKLRHPL